MIEKKNDINLSTEILIYFLSFVKQQWRSYMDIICICICIWYIVEPNYGFYTTGRESADETIVSQFLLLTLNPSSSWRIKTDQSRSLPTIQLVYVLLAFVSCRGGHGLPPCIGETSTNLNLVTMPLLSCLLHSCQSVTTQSINTELITYQFLMKHG
jgi:hypothetical protein